MGVREREVARLLAEDAAVMSVEPVDLDAQHERIDHCIMRHAKILKNLHDRLRFLEEERV